MSLTVPAEMEEALLKADESSIRLDEGALASALIKARPQTSAITPEENTGAFAEVAAWRFSRPHGYSDREPWGIYWGPMASGTLADGKPFHSPDVEEVDEDVLRHWIARATNGNHPALKARYADLAWEIGRYLKRPTASRYNATKAPIALDIPFSLVPIAIDGYLLAVERDTAEDEHHSWVYLERAIQLSVSVKDSARAQRAKAALFSHYRKLSTSGGKFRWWRLSDIAEEHGKALGLSDADEKEIIGSLEDALRCHSDINDKEHFDPHASQNAADRLTKRLSVNRAEAQRIVKQAGGVFEEAAKKASGIVAIAWLEDLIPRYRNVGLTEDMARVERTIRERAEQARGELRHISVPVEIPKEKLDTWVRAVVGSNLGEALGLIALQCMTREDDARQTVQAMVEKAPLLSMMPISIMGDQGFTTATVHSVEDDLDGRTIQHAADNFQWTAPFLHSALEGAKTKYGFDLDAIVAFLNDAPFFAPGREPLLREGLAAWLGEDPVKAIHVLVPQVEAACRDLLVALGAPVMKPDPHTGGLEVIGMGAVLSHPAFRAGVPKDIRFHLRALYTDPRGINLRNHLAHGLAHIALFGMGLANWVVHSLLLLAVLRLKKPQRS